MSETTDQLVYSDSWTNISEGTLNVRVVNQDETKSIIIRESESSPIDSDSDGEIVSVGGARGSTRSEGTEFYCRAIPTTIDGNVYSAKISLTK